MSILISNKRKIPLLRRGAAKGGEVVAGAIAGMTRKVPGIVTKEPLSDAALTAPVRDTPTTPALRATPPKEGNL